MIAHSTSLTFNQPCAFPGQFGGSSIDFAHRARIYPRIANRRATSLVGRAGKAHGPGPSVFRDGSGSVRRRLFCFDVIRPGSRASPCETAAGPVRIRGRGGIGRHARFRFWWRKPWGFKSLRPHHTEIDAPGSTLKPQVACGEGRWRALARSAARHILIGMGLHQCR